MPIATVPHSTSGATPSLASQSAQPNRYAEPNRFTPPFFAVCALVATRTDSELQEVLGGEALASFDLSFFSSATAPQLVGGLLAKVGTTKTLGWFSGTQQPRCRLSRVCVRMLQQRRRTAAGGLELLIVAAAGRDACAGSDAWAQACCLPAPEQSTAGEQDVLVKRLRHMLGDLTFMEAFHHTGANHHSTTLLDGCLCLFGLAAVFGLGTSPSWKPSTTRVRNARVWLAVSVCLGSVIVLGLGDPTFMEAVRNT